MGSAKMVANPLGYLDLVLNSARGIPTAKSAIPLYFWFSNVVNFTLPICQDLLQKHNESTYRLEYMSTNYGNLPINSTVTRKEILEGIRFSAMPGNVYDFKLFESNQLIWDYAIITEPAIPEYINMAELSPDGKKGRIRWGHPISGGFSYYVLKFRQNNGPFQTEVAKIGSFGLLGKIQPDSNYEVRVFTVYLTKQSKNYIS